MRLDSRALLGTLVAFCLGGAGDLHAQDDVSGRAADIRIGGRLHTQYSTSSVDGTVADFFFRRARFTFDMDLTDRISGRIQPEFAGGSAEVRDAWIRFDLAPAFRVAVGQFKRPFDLFFVSSSTDLSIIERDGRVDGVDECTGVGGVCSFTRLTKGLQLSDRDQGILVDGSHGRFSWAASLTNGTGTNEPDENDSKSFSGRLSMAVSDAWTVSGQVAVHDYVGPFEESATAPAWSFDVQRGDWRDGFLLQAAVAGGENWRAVDEEGEPADFLAAQAVASFYHPVGDGDGLVRGVEPLVRVSVADPDTGTDDDAGVLVTPGFMAYVTGKNKIGFNVDVYSPREGDTEYSLKLQTFLYF